MINEYKKIKTRDDVQLNALVSEGGHKTWLIQLHDYGEHHARHKFILEQSRRFCNVLQYDLRGHGDSEGDLSKLADFHTLAKDLEDIIQFLQTNYGMKDFNLVGFGLGGLIICDYLQNIAKSERYPAKVFLSGPVLFMHGALGRLYSITEKYVFNIIDKLSVDISIPHFIDSKKLSHDGRVYQSYQLDERCKTSISSSFLLKILSAIKEISSRPIRANCQMAITLAGDDQIINPDLVQDYFQRFEKSSRVLLIDGAYRELHHEVEMFRSSFESFFKDFMFEKTISRKVLA